jgi:crotonobetainyl-CoA:carnitine CoA-transferase CaiB-like acyl-CoA transferase
VCASSDSREDLDVTISEQRMPLDDVRVLDLTVARAGPSCVRQLADWGADVVRIEAPAESDTAGGIGERRHGSDYQNLHRNKRSLAMDLKTEEGRELLGRLAETADVVVENMRPPVKERLGCDYATLRQRNPRLVYGSISGFGQDGPYRELGSTDQIAQGMSGLMSVTGMPGTEPTRVGIAVSDLAAGLYLAIGILVALHERQRTGEGRWVQTSLIESMIGMMDFQMTRWTIDGEVPVQEGNHHPTMVPMGCFPTSDGAVNVVGSGGRILERFLDVIELPDLLLDPRFDSGQNRSEHRSALNALIASRLQTRSSAEWIDAFHRAGVPCGPVYRIDEVFNDPQVQFLEMVTEVDHPSLGPQALVRNPIAMPGTPPTVRRPTPDVGEHTREVLAELGMSHEVIDELLHRGVIQVSD